MRNLNLAKIATIATLALALAGCGSSRVYRSAAESSVPVKNYVLKGARNDKPLRLICNRGNFINNGVPQGNLGVQGLSNRQGYVGPGWMSLTVDELEDKLRWGCGSEGGESKSSSRGGGQDNPDGTRGTPGGTGCCGGNTGGGQDSPGRGGGDPTGGRR